jgi:hypothetical protein
MRYIMYKVCLFGVLSKWVSVGEGYYGMNVNTARLNKALHLKL